MFLNEPSQQDYLNTEADAPLTKAATASYDYTPGNHLSTFEGAAHDIDSLIKNLRIKNRRGPIGQSVLEANKNMVLSLADMYGHDAYVDFNSEHKLWTIGQFLPELVQAHEGLRKNPEGKEYADSIQDGLISKSITNIQHILHRSAEPKVESYKARGAISEQLFILAINIYRLDGTLALPSLFGEDSSRKIDIKIYHPGKTKIINRQIKTRNRSGERRSAKTPIIEVGSLDKNYTLTHDILFNDTRSDWRLKKLARLAIGGSFTS